MSDLPNPAEFAAPAPPLPLAGSSAAAVAPAPFFTPTTGELRPAAGMAFVGGTHQMKPAVADNWLVHFLRYLLIGIVMGLLFYIVVGFVWFMAALSATGRRKRVILMLFIPIWGTVVSVQTIWRYTSRNIYWSVRTDRPSKSLFAG